MKRENLLLNGTKVGVTAANQHILSNYLTNYEIHEFPKNKAAYSLEDGNVSWHHPTDSAGLIIDFGDPRPALPGDYIGFSVQRTNACGINSEPFYFQYQGPPVYM